MGPQTTMTSSSTTTHVRKVIFMKVRILILVWSLLLADVKAGSPDVASFKPRFLFGNLNINNAIPPQLLNVNVIGTAILSAALPILLTLPVLIVLPTILYEILPIITKASQSGPVRAYGYQQHTYNYNRPQRYKRTVRPNYKPSERPQYNPAPPTYSTNQAHPFIRNTNTNANVGFNDNVSDFDFPNDILLDFHDYQEEEFNLPIQTSNPFLDSNLAWNVQNVPDIILFLTSRQGLGHDKDSDQNGKDETLSTKRHPQVKESKIRICTSAQCGKKVLTTRPRIRVSPLGFD